MAKAPTQTTIVDPPQSAAQKRKARAEVMEASEATNEERLRRFRERVYDLKPLGLNPWPDDIVKRLDALLAAAQEL